MTVKIGIDARTLSYEHTGIPVYVHDVLQYWNEKKNDDDIMNNILNKKYNRKKN